MQEKDENGFMKVAATIKHIVYGGGEAGGVNTAHQYGGINHFYNGMLPPFIKTISEGGSASLMVSHASLDRIPMSANKFMLKRALRDDLENEYAVEPAVRTSVGSGPSKLDKFM
ncbi:beta-glucosidase [Penicillium sp. IBT 35674x]|nr:beta-glucosidase [Penicillium sp. IBT 35674x]